MDVDRFISQNSPTWVRFRDLLIGARRDIKMIPDDQIGELLALYDRCSTHLSYARTNFHDAALNQNLTLVVHDAGDLLHGTRPRSIKGVFMFFGASFPAAVWRGRWFVLAAAMMTFVPAAIVGVWIAHSPAALEAAAPAAIRDAYVEQNFEDYYTNESAAAFSAHVFTNNVQVSIGAFALGITFGIGTAALLIFNGSNVGFAAGMFAAYGELPKFFGLILPHGLLELTAIVIAGGAGLQMGWAIVSPGDRKRGTALMEQARRSVVIVLGLVVAFAGAGLIEGFITGHIHHVYVRVGIGVVVWLAFCTWIVWGGRRAVARGYSGELGEAEKPTFKIAAA